jgi:beta-glucosidase
MKFIKRIFITVTVSCIYGQLIPGQQTNPLPQLGKSSVKEVIAAMTLEEKASIVVGAGLNIDPSMAKMLGKEAQRMIPQPGGLASKTKNPIKAAAGNTIEIPRLGIPCMVVNDGPAGLRMLGGKYKCTAFPVGTLLASTWDKALIFKVGQAYANDVLEYGIDILLAPGMNIQRNPLCGRNFEYYSEDPLVSGKIAAAMVNGIQSQGVGTSVKHFAANNQETDRASVNTIVSERALREIYLQGFRIVVEEAHPWTVMSSYNLLNGTYTSENYDLITKVLKNDWGFKGLVMSDWLAGNDAVAQVKAGNDLMMPGPYQVDAIIQAVKERKLDENLLDRNIENILNTILKTPRFKNYKYSNLPDTVANAEISRKAAADGMVLLKNDNNVLPLKNDKKNIALFGNASYETLIGGSGSGYVAVAYKINIMEGLNNAGYLTDKSLEETYRKYMRENEPKQTDMIATIMGGKKRAPEMPVDSALTVKMAEKSDVAFITIGRSSGEGADRNIENDFGLSATEKTLIHDVTSAFHAKGKKVVVILNIGGVVETESWRSIPDAILLAWQPGQEAGNAIADLISGKVNPSGKLAVTFPISYTDVPSAKNFPGTEVKDDPIIKRKVVYEEGIYVGYRYYNTWGIETAYEFGYGLSYTNFSYSNLKLSASDFKDKIVVTLDVKNTGKVAGREIVQLYLSAPAKLLDKPESELKGFDKTKLLLPGESQTISFVLTPRELASFNTPTSSWDAEAGKYIVKIGASSKAIRISDSFELKKYLTVRKESVALMPPEKIHELKPVK